MIEYKYGDLLKDCSAPFLLHQTNCMGIMGGGIAAQIKRENPQVYKAYYELCEKQKTIGDLLGTIQILPRDVQTFSTPQFIVNCFGQKHVSNRFKMTSYDALDNCFMEMKKYCKGYYPEGCSIGLPFKIGCGLGGGNWEIVEAIISKNFPANENILVEIFVLPEEMGCPFI